ncbi:MAG: nuclear transport factor 2 family protein [Burkholderiaceae bacterium]
MDDDGNDNKKTLERFYSAFARLDPETMSACYDPAVTFEDEVFSLQGREETMAMWRMLCSAVEAKGKDVWRLEWSDVRADGRQGQAHWEAHYRFTATGRMVHNVIEARFDFSPDGLIVRHHDSFPFWRWARQALGPAGLALGWTPFLRAKVRAQANANLRRFMGAGGAA